MIPAFPSLPADVQMDFAKRPATQMKEPDGPMLPAQLSLYGIQAYLVLLCPTGVAFFKESEGKTLQQQRSQPLY